MPDHLGKSGHADRATRRVISCWPRLMDLQTASAYCSVGARTIEDWIHDRIIDSIPMPGSTIKDKGGNVIARAGARRIAKILIDRIDLDALIESRKAGSE